MARGDLTPRAGKKKAPPKPRRNEADMLQLLKERVEADPNGTGASAVLMPHVRDQVGYDASRTIDAIGIGMWPSRGLVIDAYEVKVSRSDWLKELRTPAKAERFGPLVDRFTLVVDDPDIVKAGELPATWGLLYVAGGRLRQKVEPTFLHVGDETMEAQQRMNPRSGPITSRSPLPPGVNRGYVAALVRSASRVGPPSHEALAKAREEAREAYEAAHDSEVRILTEQLAQERAIRQAFERESGVRLQTWREGNEDAEEVGRALKALRGDSTQRDRIRRDLEHDAEVLERHAQSARAAAAALAARPVTDAPDG